MIQNQFFSSYGFTQDKYKIGEKIKIKKNNLYPASIYDKVGIIISIYSQEEFPSGKISPKLYIVNINNVEVGVLEDDIILK